MLHLINNVTPVYGPECSGNLGGGVFISLNHLWFHVSDSNELVHSINLILWYFYSRILHNGYHLLSSLLPSISLVQGCNRQRVTVGGRKRKKKIFTNRQLNEEDFPGGPVV